MFFWLHLQGSHISLDWNLCPWIFFESSVSLVRSNTNTFHHSADFPVNTLRIFCLTLAGFLHSSPQNRVTVWNRIVCDKHLAFKQRKHRNYIHSTLETVNHPIQSYQRNQFCDLFFATSTVFWTVMKKWTAKTVKQTTPPPCYDVIYFTSSHISSQQNMFSY